MFKSKNIGPELEKFPYDEKYERTGPYVRYTKGLRSTF